MRSGWTLGTDLPKKGHRHHLQSRRAERERRIRQRLDPSPWARTESAPISAWNSRAVSRRRNLRAGLRRRGGLRGRKIGRIIVPTRARRRPIRSPGCGDRPRSVAAGPRARRQIRFGCRTAVDLGTGIMKNAAVRACPSSWRRRRRRSGSERIVTSAPATSRCTTRCSTSANPTRCSKRR